MDERVTFSWLDYSVVALTLIAFVTLGLSVRLREYTVLQYIAAGRRLSLPLFVATLVTTWYGGILGVGEAFDFYGLSTWVILGVPYYVFGVAYALFMAHRVREDEQISLPERMERCYGRPTSIVSAFLVLILGLPAAHIAMMATLAEVTTGLPYVWSAVIGTLFGTLFLYRGGLLADARANTLSFVLMYLSFMIMLIIAVAKFGAPMQLIQKLPETSRSWDAGQGVFFVLSWFLIGAWTFVDPGFHQRVTSIRNPDLARKGVLISVLCWMFFDLLTTGVALYAYSALGSGKGLKLFPLFGDAVLPSGLKGLFFAGMFGIIISSLVGYTFVSGSTIGRDLISRAYPKISETKTVWITRFGVFLATVLGLVFALLIPSVVYLWYDLGSIAIPGLLLPVFFAYATRWRPYPVTAFASMLFGSLGALTWYLLVTRNPNVDFSSWLESLAWLSLFRDKPIWIGLCCALFAFSIGVLVESRRKRYAQRFVE
ncbi:MAG TPA: sodium:solute symporter family protein [Fimbriimonadales bacterium]|nr:sodium:solute symporter family protein [Fimbriimonadales bacterium]